MSPRCPLYRPRVGWLALLAAVGALPAAADLRAGSEGGGAIRRASSC